MTLVFLGAKVPMFSESYEDLPVFRSRPVGALFGHLGKIIQLIGMTKYRKA